jgi:hypothetical protein
MLRPAQALQPAPRLQPSPRLQPAPMLGTPFQRAPDLQPHIPALPHARMPQHVTLPHAGSPGSWPHYGADDVSSDERMKKDKRPNHRTEDDAFAMFGDRVPHKRDAYGSGSGPMEQPNNDYTPQAAGFDQQFIQHHKGPSIVVSDIRMKTNRKPQRFGDVDMDRNIETTGHTQSGSAYTDKGDNHYLDAVDAPYSFHGLNMDPPTKPPGGMYDRVMDTIYRKPMDAWARSDLDRDAAARRAQLVTSDNRAKADAIAQQGHAHGYAQAVRDIVRRDGTLDLPPPPPPPETKTWAQARSAAAPPAMSWQQAQYEAAHRYDNPPQLPPPPAPTADARVATVPNEDAVTSDKRAKTAMAKQEKSAKTPDTEDAGDAGGKEENEAKEYGKEPPRSKHPGPSKDEDIKAQDEPTHDTEDDTYGGKSSRGAGPGPTKTAEKIPEGSNGGDGFEARIAAARREGFEHGHAHASGRMGLPEYMSDNKQHFADVDMNGNQIPGQSPMAQPPQNQGFQSDMRPWQGGGQRPMGGQGQQSAPQMGVPAGFPPRAAMQQPRPQVPPGQPPLQQMAQGLGQQQRLGQMAQGLGQQQAQQQAVGQMGQGLAQQKALGQMGQGLAQQQAQRAQQQANQNYGIGAGMAGANQSGGGGGGLPPGWGVSGGAGFNPGTPPPGGGGGGAGSDANGIGMMLAASDIRMKTDAHPQHFHDVNMAGGPPPEAFGDEGYHQAIHYGIPEDLARKAYIERRLAAPEPPRRNVDARLAAEPAPGRERPVGDDQYRQAILHGLPQDRAMGDYMSRRMAPPAVREPVSMTHFQQGQFTPAPSFGPGRQMNARAWPEQFSDKDYAARVTSPGGALERNAALAGGVERIGTHAADVSRYPEGRRNGEPVFSPDHNGVLRAERGSPPAAHAQWLTQLEGEANRTRGQLQHSVDANNRVLDEHAAAVGDRYAPSGLARAMPSTRPDPADEAIRRVAGRRDQIEDDNPYDDGAD